MDPAARVQLRLGARLDPTKKTITDYSYNSRDYFPPFHIQCPPTLRMHHMNVANCAYTVIQSLIFVHSLRSQHLFAMCPERSGPVFDKHAASIRRLQEWKEQTNELNPTLAPAAKIPAAALGFRFDQRAYDTYVNLYMETLKKFYAIEYMKYSRAVGMMKHVASYYLGHNDYRIWLYWYHRIFKPAMGKWDIFLKDVDMPSWEDSVDELYDLVVKCVEDSEDKTATQLAQGICSGQIKNS